MTKSEALKAIKTLRDQINDGADCSANADMWENAVIATLDDAADLIEFPSVGFKQLVADQTPAN